MKNLMRAAGVVVLLATAAPAQALVPVEDVVVIARLADTIKNQMAMLNTLMQTLTVANAMKAALGEGPGAEWAAALESFSGLYSESNQLMYNVANKRTSLQWEVDRLTPARLENMTVPELISFGRAWQDALQQDSLSARALQAEGIAQQAKINSLRAQSLINSQQAQGATSAIQAQTNLLGAVAGQLETTGLTLSSMANMQNNALITDDKKNQIVEQMTKRNREIGAQMRQAGVKKAARSLLLWGSP
jgi:hypothetical protein